MPGLDPGIHVDGRDKPGHDDGGAHAAHTHGVAAYTIVFEGAVSRLDFARALGAARAGNAEAAKADIAKLAELRDQLREAKDATGPSRSISSGRLRTLGCCMPRASTTTRSRP